MFKLKWRNIVNGLLHMSNSKGVYFNKTVTFEYFYEMAFFKIHTVKLLVIKSVDFVSSSMSLDLINYRELSLNYEDRLIQLLQLC